MKRNNQAGVALLSAILVLMLMSALLVGFVAMVTADQTASGINRDQTQAYAAAHAGVEKLTADLGQLFSGNFAPTGPQIATLTTPAMQPVLPGISYLAPNGGTGYRITFRDVNGDNNPDIADPNGTQIAAGPYQGLVGLITPYDIEVTARTIGGAEVRMRRTMQTIGIPVFQFGIFSENDQSFFAGPNFAFGGRVHTNQNLFLKQDANKTLTLGDRVTAVGEVIRTHLANGVTGTHPGDVRMARATGCPAITGNNGPAAPPATCFNLTEGSLVANVGSAENEPNWTNISMGTSNGWIRNGRTGARRLDLPIVSDGAAPVDLIRRPPVGEVATSAIGRQRFYNMATLRILISDRPEDLTGLPGVDWTPGGPAASPVRLTGNLIVSAGEANANTLPAGNHPFATSTGSVNDGFRTAGGTSLIDGFILINRQDRNGDWDDVTKEILNYGFASRRISDGNLWTPNWNNDCNDPHPNAIIRFQRYRDNMGNVCSAANATLPANEGISTNFWPNTLYDPREGMLRDDENARPTNPGGVPNITNLPTAWHRLYWGGVMHYVELDVNNLRRWLRGELGGSNNAACINGLGGTNCAMDQTGFVVYFSDRRTNRDLGPNGVADPPTVDAVTGAIEYGDDRETGEFGVEDNINPGDANSLPNFALDAPFVDVQGNNRWAEDVNFDGVLQNYGGTARLLPNAWMANVTDVDMTPFGQGVTNNFTLWGSPAGFGNWGVPIDRNTARVNRAFFFRRALKLVNGGRGNLPANGTQGLTVASENPVYIQGNYNACTNAVPNQGNNFDPACAGGAGFGNQPGVDHVSAAVIADAVTLLSNSWNDIRSFVNPHDPGVAGLVAANSKQATTTWYRLGIIGGKGLNFPRPAGNPRDNQDFGTDGGAHNFLRYIENWGVNATLNYRGSILSFYTSRQAVGTYKCCSIVYSPPLRGYNFDQEFLNPNLLPPRTPMFRDLNTLTFRQILRPTQ
jgi:hypothetical protein